MLQHPRRSTVARWLLAAIVGTGIAAASAASALAHVNRQVGPYTILVVLVEEPTFEDNHAGFQFWVRRDGQPIVGLERTIQAEATGHGEHVSLAVPPLDGLGFYVLDRSLAGTAFDPLGGGAWSLHLWGDIDGTPLDEQLAVTFPSYPRIGAANQASAAAAAAPGPPIGVLVLALIGLGLAMAIVVAARFVRPRPGRPTPARPR